VDFVVEVGRDLWGIEVKSAKVWSRVRGRKRLSLRPRSVDGMPVL
jgi:hypothetical protein